MARLPEYPTFDEWLVALQTGPELAEQHVQQLRLQAMAYGLAYAQPILLSSIQDYESAQAQLATRPARQAPEATSTAAASAPEPLLDVYPDLQQWQALIAADAGTAWRQFAALELQAARYGALNASPMLNASIQAYKDANSSFASAEPPVLEQSPAAEAATPDAQPSEPAAEDQPWWKRLLDR